MALDAMAGAVEHPFSVGRYPITNAQLDALSAEVADLCLTYDIPVSRWSVLTHAEVQPTLGIWQRAKWDITWLPDMMAPGDPVAVGDRLREMTRRNRHVFRQPRRLRGHMNNGATAAAGAYDRSGVYVETDY